MSADRHIWYLWARRLHRWGMQELVASILEAFGSLTILGAQAIHISQPLLSQAFPDDHLTALAGMLEDRHETQAFIGLLREATAD